MLILPVQLAGDDMETGKNCDCIGKHSTFDDAWEDGVVVERWWTNPKSIGGITSVGVDEVTQFATGSFGCTVNGRSWFWPDAVSEHDKFEVMN